VNWRNGYNPRCSCYADSGPSVFRDRGLFLFHSSGVYFFAVLVTAAAVVSVPFTKPAANRSPRPTLHGIDRMPAAEHLRHGGCSRSIAPASPRSRSEPLRRAVERTVGTSAPIIPGRPAATPFELGLHP
jgi:hypothetical protein